VNARGRCTAGSRVLATAPLCMLAGCLVGFVDGIPCVEDAQCPTDAFCDLTTETCLADAAGSGGPDVQVTGVVDEGAIVIDPFVPGETTTELSLVLVNVGGHDAVDIALRMGPLACLAPTLDDTAVPAVLGPGEEARVPFSVTPRLCSTPVIQDWFTRFSGRGARGTFNIVVERAPPSFD
jgi:hypothetical protein